MTKALLIVTAAVEAGAGLALLGVPSVTASLLFGAPVEASAATGLARIGGAAILTLAIVCWLIRDADGLVSRGLIAGMAFYNIAVGVVLAFAGVDGGLHGVLLWPAVIFHAAMAGWCIATLFRRDNVVVR